MSRGCKIARLPNPIDPRATPHSTSALRLSAIPLSLCVLDAPTLCDRLLPCPPRVKPRLQDLRHDGLMHGDIAAALLEFLTGPAWTRIVASNLWRCSAKGTRVAQCLGLMRSLILEVAVNSYHSSSSTHNQFLPHLRANWLFIRTHNLIETVFVRQRKNGNKPSAMLFII